MSHGCVNLPMDVARVDVRMGGHRNRGQRGFLSSSHSFFIAD